MWSELKFAVWMSLLKVSLGGVIELNFTKDDQVSPTMIMAVDHLSTHSGENITQEQANLGSADTTRVNFKQQKSGLNVQPRQTQQVQKNKTLKIAVSNLLVTFAEAFSKAAALPIAVAIALVNKVSNATNSTLYIGGEITKLPVTIANSIIQEMSNITFPN